MKISTKIIAGYGILIALMVGLLAHEIYTIQRMQSIITRLSDVNFEAADIALRMRNNIELVEEFARKSFVSADPGYRDRLQEYRQLYAGELSNIEAIGRTREEQAEIQRLAGFWSAFNAELARRLAGPGDPTQGIPDVLTEQLAQLKDQTHSVYLAAIRAIHAEVKVFGRTSRMAATVSWIVAAAALVLSGLVSFLIVQSISSPLRQLTQGTRALTEGKFFYRLDTTRRDEFGQLAKDFNSMTRRLNELDQMKKDFVAHVSHELKAPLASQQETIQLLLDQIPGPVNDKQKRLLELALASCQRLSAMIGNLLDLSRMEAGVMEYELKSHDLAALIRAVVAELQPHGDARDAATALDLPGQPFMIDCDADRIMQVLRNLLSNAGKFSKGKEITVRLTATREIPAGMPEHWRAKVPPPSDARALALVAVADSGPGVPDAHKEKIFEKFHQVKQGKKIPGQGAGLGLAISRTIAEAHRAALWVDDNPEGGSIFYLLIPPGENTGQTSYRESSPI
jgi:two-component system sensor histidine kinase GlrK